MPVLALSNPLSQEALFYRCYKDIVNERPPLDHPQLLQVKSGSKSAIDACMTILNNSKFVGEKIPKVSGDFSKESIKVVKNFHRIHRSWFSVEEFSFLDNYGKTGQYDAMESQQGALHYTSALFNPSVNFNSIVTRSKSLRGIRHTDFEEVNGQNRTFSVRILQYFAELMGFQYSIDHNNHSELSLSKTQLGKLVGVTEQPDVIVPMSWGGDRYYDRHESGHVTGEPQFIPNLNLYEHLGSGFMGTSSYLLMNDNTYKVVVRKNGGLKTARRWTRNVFKDLLCRDLPVLRAEDVTAMIDTKSSLPFRGAQNCMQCHATIDPFARTIRNTRRVLTSPPVKREAYAKDYRELSLIHRFEPDYPTANENWPEDDIYWHRRPPKGQLYFRQYDGTLFQQDLNNLAEAGGYLKNLDDIYICAAKRYYEHFTGINVNTSDLQINPIADSPYKIKELSYRNYVIKLGKELKVHQDPLKTIESILKSEGYKYPGLKVE